MLLAPAQFREMPGWADAEIKPAVLEGKAPEEHSTGQALIGGTQDVAMEGACRLGVRNT